MLEGDGTTHARVRFACVRGDLEVSVRLDESGHLLEASLEPDPRAACVP